MKKKKKIIFTREKEVKIEKGKSIILDAELNRSIYQLKD